MSDSDRIDRLEALVETMVNTVTRFHDEFVELARTNAAEHAEYRQDVARLYAAFSDHYRDSHGGGTP